MIWFIWFTISLLDTHIAHIPTEDMFETEEACKAAIPSWEKLIHEQFPDDRYLSVYCEQFRPKEVHDGPSISTL